MIELLLLSPEGHGVTISEASVELPVVSDILRHAVAPGCVNGVEFVIFGFCLIVIVPCICSKAFLS